jgi:hypothetical protein
MKTFVFRLIGAFVAIVFSIVAVNFLIGTLIFWVKFFVRLKKVWKLPYFQRNKKKVFLSWWHNIRTMKINDFLRLSFTDLFLKDKGFSLFGIYTFVGYFGEGKTLGMVRFARHIKKKYQAKGIDVHIAANFKLKDQDIMVTDWRDILTLPKNTILLFDEIHTTFDTQGFSDFPMDLLTHLTQQRKRKLAIFTSTQVYKQAVIQIRRITYWVVTSKNILHRDRWFSYDFYHKDKFEALEESNTLMTLMNKRRYKEFNYNFVAMDADYNAYDTEHMITAKNIRTEESVNKKRRKQHDQVLQVLESV